MSSEKKIKAEIEFTATRLCEAGIQPAAIAIGMLASASAALAQISGTDHAAGYLRAVANSIDGKADTTATPFDAVAYAKVIQQGEVARSLAIRAQAVMTGARGVVEKAVRLLDEGKAKEARALLAPEAKRVAGPTLQ